MTRSEHIVDAFASFREAAEPAGLPYGVEKVPSAGEEFPWIGLVSHVPDDPVPAGIVHREKRHGKLHNAQTAGQVTACVADNVDYPATDLLSQLHAVLKGKLPDLFRIFYAVKYARHYFLLSGR